MCVTIRTRGPLENIKHSMSSSEEEDSFGLAASLRKRASHEYVARDDDPGKVGARYYVGIGCRKFDFDEDDPFSVEDYHTEIRRRIQHGRRPSVGDAGRPSRLGVHREAPSQPLAAAVEVATDHRDPQGPHRVGEDRLMLPHTFAAAAVGCCDDHPLDPDMVAQATVAMTRVADDPDICHNWMVYAPKLALAESKRCIEAVRQRLRVAIFKIGITRDPLTRFRGVLAEGQNRWRPYIHEGFTNMELLLCSAPDHCAELETHLISEYRKTPGCRNVNPGGESRPPDSCCCFTYVVFAEGGAGVGLLPAAREAAKRRRLEKSVREAARERRGL